ncbi:MULTISPECIES: D-cysteine desulfhydrase family protein [Psychrobacter]|uniref:D-cysteine desulfhydrase family protein n=2 Tax=Psychrobacter TaxID=497 RepID=A0ABR8RHB1_9GAMM|nr:MULTISPECIES: D-cysteine desulfhydrase family protein [Psychrobacter]MBD7947099.1 D-cysteine desulfhydrase family protein [Psychrobacter communis]MDP4545822.1 D-cysteine desulfhydrase family protein [Psychrobacter faecalis]
MEYNHIPRELLGFFPTPLVELKRLSAALGGPKIYMKRDDNTGLALGGNKTRKLEFILGDALAKGADTIITAGAIQSNHCRQTAAAAASLGLECHLVLGGEEPEQANGNLLLDKLFGCHIHWAGNHRKGEDIPRIVEQLTNQGKNVYVVPYGGSSELGALAFVEAFKELESQRQSMGFSLTHIVFASSSGGTQAGLMLGNKIFNSPYQIVGINIDKGETDKVAFDQYTLALANNTAKLINTDYEFTASDLILNSDYVGEGYGVVGALENEAIALTAQTEGILVDPVYTGRAMGGLTDMIRTGKIKKTDSVLFWHTGGAPALFAYGNDLDLAKKSSKQEV